MTRNLVDDIILMSLLFTWWYRYLFDCISCYSCYGASLIVVLLLFIQLLLMYVCHQPSVQFK